MSAGVSVILCTRNGHSRGFLRESLRSVLEQTAPPAEVILVDDGSTDGTADWVRENFPTVRVVKNTGSGLASARNTGVGNATQPWVAFTDDDDVWLPDKLAEQIAQIATVHEPKAAILVARAAIIEGANDAPKIAQVPLHLTNWPACLIACPVIVSGAFLSRDLLIQIGPFKESLKVGSAYDFWIRCLQAGFSVHYSDKILLHRRMHGAQMTDHSRLPSLVLAADEMILPYLQELPQALASRIRTARILIWVRSLAWKCGLRPAAHYWTNSALRSRQFAFHALPFFLLDTIASRTSVKFGERLRMLAYRLLEHRIPGNRNS